MVRVDAAVRGWQATRRLGPAAGDATAGEESAPAALVVAKPVLQPRTSGGEALCLCCKRPAAACRWRCLPIKRAAARRRQSAMVTLLSSAKGAEWGGPAAQPAAGGGL